MSESFETATPAASVDLKKTRRNGHASRAQLVDRLPPHSPEAEQAVIGCCLTDNKTIERCEEKLKSGHESFYDLRHQIIYEGILSLSVIDGAVDIITLQQWLKDRQKLDEVGGIPYLNRLQDCVPSAANVDYYLDIVSEKATLRKLLATCAKVSEEIYEFTGDVDELLDRTEKDVLQFRNDQIPKFAIDGRVSGDHLADDLERRMQLDGKLSGLDTGLPDLNQMLEGLQFGEQVVIGARPSMGKTALGLGMFTKLAYQQKVPSLFISLEMSSKALMRRMLSSTTGIPMNTIKRGSYSESDFKKFIAFRSLCCKCPMFIIDGVTGMTSREISTAVRKMVLKHGIKFVVVDYLQKVKPDSRHEKRTYEVADISGKLRAIAVETNVAMVTLAQLNRDNQKDKGRPPRLSDLGDSGQIERDADTVLLIHRDAEKCFLIVAKQRDGETGIVPVVFNGPLCRFESKAYETD